MENSIRLPQPQTAQATRIPRTPFFPAYRPKTGLVRAPATVIRLNTREKLPLPMPSWEQTGSRKKLSVDEVTAMAIMVKKAATAGRYRIIFSFIILLRKGGFITRLYCNLSQFFHLLIRLRI